MLRPHLPLWVWVEHQSTGVSYLTVDINNVKYTLPWHCIVVSNDLWLWLWSHHLHFTFLHIQRNYYVFAPAVRQILYLRRCFALGINRRATDWRGNKECLGVLLNHPDFIFLLWQLQVKMKNNKSLNPVEGLSMLWMMCTMSVTVNDNTNKCPQWFIIIFSNRIYSEEMYVFWNTHELHM